MNLAQILERSAQFFPKNPAVRQEDLTLSYAQLNENANKVATGLISMGIKPRDLVAISAPNSADWITMYYGIIKAGASAVTLFSTITSEELSNLLKHSKPKMIFTTPERIPDLKPLLQAGIIEKVICSSDSDFTIKDLMDKGTADFKAYEMQRDDIAAILYTGGTTGMPKGVMLKHEGIIFSSYSIASCEHSLPGDMALCLNPLNHVFGQIHIMTSTVISAGCLVFITNPDIDKILALTGTGTITKFFQVPTMYVRLLNVPDLKKKLGNVKYCFSAGATMAREIVLRWKEATGITISESLGMTEAMPITFNHYYPEKHVIGSVGQPVWSVEVQIRDIASGELLKTGEEGEICIKSPSVMKGYLNNPEATKEAFYEGGWMRTGDIGVFDEDNFLFFKDRLKELIITGGENVLPKEVEEVLYTASGIGECTVVGLPDAEWGERVTAFYTLKPGMTVDQKELKTYLKTKLAPFKVPKEYVCVDELPKSGAGKILKREVKKQYLEKNPEKAPVAK